MEQAEDKLVNAVLLVYASILLGVLIWLLGGMTGRLHLVVGAFVGYQLMIWYALAGAGIGVGIRHE